MGAGAVNATGASFGAHNLLQVRKKLLNDQLRETLVRWYPAFRQQKLTPNVA